jgi:hypothetical protein
MIPILFALALAAAPADAPPVGLEIWRGAKVGMTPQAVKTLFPAVRPVVDGESLLDNAKERLKLDGARLPTGDRASARFFFRDGGLNEVKLLVEAPPGKTAANVARAAAVSDSLTPVYGKPIACGAREGLLAYQCDWMNKGLSVSVTYMDVAGQSPLLDVTLRAIGPADAESPHAPPLPKSRAALPGDPVSKPEGMRR